MLLPLSCLVFSTDLTKESFCTYPSILQQFLQKTNIYTIIPTWIRTWDFVYMCNKKTFSTMLLRWFEKYVQTISYVNTVRKIIWNASFNIVPYIYVHGLPKLFHWCKVTLFLSVVKFQTGEVRKVSNVNSTNSFKKVLQGVKKIKLNLSWKQWLINKFKGWINKSIE